MSLNDIQCLIASIKSHIPDHVPMNMLLDKAKILSEIAVLAAELCDRISINDNVDASIKSLTAQIEHKLELLNDQD